MSTVTRKTVSTTFPPPTINSLGPSQRSRLLRSTRKLENLLGAIPQPGNFTLHEKSKSQDVYVSSPTASPVGLVVQSISTAECIEHSEAASQIPISRKHSKRRSVPIPRPLSLHLNNVRIEHYESSPDSPQVLILPPAAIPTPSPLSPLFASEDEPMSPAQVPQETIRRKRMTKLTRTLGENVPTEFILPHGHLRLTQHQRSPSEPSARSLWPDWGENESEDESVVTNSTMSTTLPPPTINSLDPSRRARLLKSTRKLENVLGTAPQVEASAVLPRVTTKPRHISMVSFPVSSPDSPDSPESLELPNLPQNGHVKKHSKHKPAHLPRPLILRHNNVSAVTRLNVRIDQQSSADLAQELTIPRAAITTPSPLSPLFADEPMTPVDVPQEKIRRMRMAKLTRTLGENIPTEFILPHDRLKFTQHQRSPSEPSARSLWPDWGKRESEAAVVNTSTTVPPPTINSLGPSQRARLLKSTRKLENLLGATPQVEESAMLPPITQSSRHISKISFPVSSAEPVDSIPTSLRLSQNGPVEKHSKHKSVHLPPPLVLRHNNVSTITKLNVRIEQPLSADPAQELTLPHTTNTTPSPLSPLFADEPMTPVDVPQEKIRRMRMAKLTRTLGENIPTEFILTRDRLELSQHQRSPSEPSPRSLWPDWTREGEGTAALDSLSKQRPRTASVIDNDPTLTNATTVPSNRSKPAIIRKLRRRHESVGPDVVLSSTLFTVTPSSPERPSSPVNPSDSETTEDDDVDVILGSDWRGEWNIKDAQERAMVLRNLRHH